MLVATSIATRRSQSPGWLATSSMPSVASKTWRAPAARLLEVTLPAVPSMMATWPLPILSMMNCAPVLPTTMLSVV